MQNGMNGMRLLLSAVLLIAKMGRPCGTAPVADGRLRMALMIALAGVHPGCLHRGMLTNVLARILPRILGMQPLLMGLGLVGLCRTMLRRLRLRLLRLDRTIKMVGGRRLLAASGRT